ncbi:hypothetical protein [Sulfuriferula thiophila]|uniref:hypothetical protein n=1 Tax=Sulfuriferula thiophila TaxID=1781211 RepID=UPI001CB96C0A|nr:hypothetical protein [Sulfuriferula thiophila]
MRQYFLCHHHDAITIMNIYQNDQKLITTLTAEDNSPLHQTVSAPCIPPANYA